MRIEVDPNAKAGGFGHAATGQYRLRVKAIDLKEGPKAQYLNWVFEFADPNVQPTDPELTLGSVYEITTLKVGENAQFRLHQVCDALGVDWGNFDTDDLIGMELDAHVKIEDYQGKNSNKVDTFIPLETVVA